VRAFGLIGGWLNHSFSPRIHALLGDYDYGLYPLKPEELDAFMRENDLDGFNVTIPYKQAVIPYMAELSPRAKTIGSVNTVVRGRDGAYFGDNTDYQGFLALLGDQAAGLRGKKAVILGSGGASKTVRAVLRDVGADPVVTVSRTGEDNYQNLFRHFDARLIVNTTPLGTYPNNGVSPIDLEPFKACTLVLDLTFNPAKTALMLQAGRLRIPCRGGLLMLVEQARAASERFQGRALTEIDSAGIADAIRRQTLNLTLIGMPGCGKTTVGTYLSQMLGRPFVDTDVQIEKRAGMDIPRIFSERGQAYFMALESEVLSDVLRESGQVVALGGGVVTVPCNRDLLEQNSTVILLEKDLNRLETEGRPLSQSVGLEALYNERRPLYLGWSDIVFQNDDSYQTAQKIKEALNL